MTKMKRITIVVPDEIDHKILELRKTEQFIRCSYAEIIRQVLCAGLAEMQATKQQDAG